MDIVTGSGRGAHWVVLVHGGAGTVPAERHATHVEGCRRAGAAAAEVLRGGGSALDAVVTAVRILEDDPSFNAGTGASLNERGEVEHDASVMEGKLLRAGGVCALPGFRNPIAVARAVLEDGRHVLYAADGAARFAQSHGFQPVPPDSLVTQAARAALARMVDGGGTGNWAGGTVGAVARDAAGTCAAATSTGGIVAKRVGRVGDSPLIGAGTYADDEAGAVSTTGHGEAMIRLCTARATVDRMRAGAPPHEAAAAEIARLRERLVSGNGPLAPSGGLIAVAPDGRWGWARSTATMSWAVASDSEQAAGIGEDATAAP